MNVRITPGHWKITSVEHGVKLAHFMNEAVASLPQVIMNREFMENFEGGILIVRPEGAPRTKWYRSYAKRSWYVVDNGEGTFTLKRRREFEKLEGKASDVFKNYAEMGKQLMVISRAADAAIKEGRYIAMNIVKPGGVLVDAETDDIRPARLALAARRMPDLRR